MPPTEHSAAGASSAERWLACSASVAAQEGYPDQTSIYAAEGSAAHHLGEMVLRQFIRDGRLPAIALYAGQKIKHDGYEFTVDLEMMEAVGTYTKYVTDLLDETPGGVLKVETSFHLTEIHDLAYGTNDAVIIEPFGWLHVIDYKHGRGHAVDVETDEAQYPWQRITKEIFGCVPNPQLLYYALGAIYAEGGDGGDWEGVKLHIVQPRTAHSDGPFRTVELSAKGILLWGDQVLRRGIMLTQQEDAEFVPGDHCKWCNAARDCAALRGVVTGAVSSPFDPVTADLQTVRAWTPPSVVAMSDEDLAKVLLFADMIDGFVANAKSEAKDRLRAGANPETLGRKLVAGRATRSWADDEAAAMALQALGVDPYNRKLKTPAQAEKSVKEVGQNKSVLKDLITESRGESLVPLTDRRPALGAPFEPLDS